MLAQQTVAAVAYEDLDVDEWFDAVRRAWPYRDLAREVFDGRGSVQQVDEADMRAQIAERQQRLESAGNQTGVLAVVSGEGLRQLYVGLGATVVDGGPTMNPSTDDLLAGIHSVGADSVLVLPNSPNVVLAAERAAELAGHGLKIQPARESLLDIKSEAEAAVNPAAK